MPNPRLTDACLPQGESIRLRLDGKWNGDSQVTQLCLNLFTFDCRGDLILVPQLLLYSEKEIKF